MKERILSGWTFVRVLYVVIGSFVIVHSIIEKQWAGVAVGAYFAAMGLFAFGCAAGNCFVGNSAAEPMSKSETNSTEVTFEEVKTK
jgi:presenilin-like A22 family membrane protease